MISEKKSANDFAASWVICMATAFGSLELPDFGCSNWDTLGGTDLISFLDGMK
jgi:hypothetical protein